MPPTKTKVMYYTYALQSKQKNILYKGSTSNLELRIIQHNESSRVPATIILKLKRVRQ
jgi:predicted GIY-YIG superfamily endonuclease